MKLLISLFLSICLFMSSSVVWCGTAIEPKGFILASNYFGFNLFEQLSKSNEKESVKKNIFFSPYSISMTFAMLNEGLGGHTSKQVCHTFGYDLAKLTNKTMISDSVRESIDRLAKSAEKNSFTLRTANAMIAAKNFDILNSYKTSVREKFNGELFEVDTEKEPDQVKKLINDWIANKTENRIEQMIKGPLPNIKMALLNAVYFKGSWKLKFEANETVNGTFTDSHNNKYDNVEFMNTKEYFNVGDLKEINSIIVELPYGGEDLSMYAILPNDKNSDMTHIKKALNPWYIEAAIGSLYNNEVKIKFPKFSFKTEYDLAPTLMKMGAKHIFSGNGDFSGITNSTKMAIDQVKHASTIDINEDGSVATAATTTMHFYSAGRYKTSTYEFDHPFIFFIRNNHNGNLLFIGELNRF